MPNSRDEVERFRALVLELGLPRPSTTYVGLRCPYCGKADRVHRLEAPEEVPNAPPSYTSFWQRHGALGEIVVCTFCRQLLVRGDGSSVRPLFVEPE